MKQTYTFKIFKIETYENTFWLSSNYKWNGWSAKVVKLNSLVKSASVTHCSNKFLFIFAVSYFIYSYSSSSKLSLTFSFSNLSAFLFNSIAFYFYKGGYSKSKDVSVYLISCY